VSDARPHGRAAEGPASMPRPRRRSTAEQGGLSRPEQGRHRVRFVLDRTLESIGLLSPTEIGLFLGLGLWGLNKIGLLGAIGWLGHRSDPPCAQQPNLRGNAFCRMAGTPRAFFYSAAASRCAFGGWWDMHRGPRRAFA
jgi:hypothetical protein